MERKLELADIVGYLPYGLSFIVTSEGKESIKERIYVDNIDDILSDVFTITEILIGTGEVEIDNGVFGFRSFIDELMPVYRPMSDLVKPMTHPDINNGEEFVPIVYISFEILGDYIPNKWEIKQGSDTVCGEIVRQTIGVEYSDNLGGGQYAVCFSKGNTSVHIRNAYGGMVDTRCTMMVIEFLQKMHFDYLGLINQNLAIDINTIK